MMAPLDACAGHRRKFSKAVVACWNNLALDDACAS